MTAQTLREYLNTEYGLKKPWPKTLEVDAHTYACACQEIFDTFEKETVGNVGYLIELALGPHNGIMFKNVELILNEEKK